MSSLLVVAFLLVAGCGDDGGTESDRVGVGRACVVSADCPQPPSDCDASSPDCRPLVCLTRFTGGYCGLEGCSGDIDCPFGSACVLHDDGINYCFRVCDNKPECNRFRPPEVEANCSSSVELVDDTGVKACVPPSSGI